MKNTNNTYAAMKVVKERIAAKYPTMDAKTVAIRATYAMNAKAAKKVAAMA